MKSIKHHLSLILPFFAMLFAMEYMLMLERVGNWFEQRLAEDNVVIVVADRQVPQSALLKSSRNIVRIEPLSAESVLERIKYDLDAQSITEIKASLPGFYALTLKGYLDADDLARIKMDLLVIKGVQSVHLFEKRYSRMVETTRFIQYNFTFLGILIGLLSLLLIFRQMRIWKLEHQERMSIMALFGAPIWLRSGVLFRLAILDSLLAAALTVALFAYLMQSPYILEVGSDLGISALSMIHWKDLIVIPTVALVISITSTSMTIMSIGEQEI